MRRLRVLLPILSSVLIAAMGARAEGRIERAAGALKLVLDANDEGIRLVELVDTSTGVPLSSGKTLPLFGLTMRRSGSDEQVAMDAEHGWSEVSSSPSGDALELKWLKPRDGRMGDLAVVARGTFDAAAGAIRWTLRVDNLSKEWSVCWVAFPQIAVADLGAEGEVFYPHGVGVVQREAWSKPFAFARRDLYPNPWCAMQYTAAYDRGRNTGLYFGIHDPVASLKYIAARGKPEEHAVQFVVDIPAEQMGVGGNGFTLSGQGVWQLLRGDWFDAAMIYRKWVQAEAKWYPELGPDGRADTPKWMRELCVWVHGGGEPWTAEGKPGPWVKELEDLQKYLGVPLGVHWYDWHAIPFDNDYPHYFPTDPGFDKAVAWLQERSVYVMPYINGRLWDTRDKGVEDFEFTRVARPAAVKDEQGEVCAESYSSKESDGSRVKLAAMCPATKLWQDRVKAVVLRLFEEFGVKGVYIDQIAAARPLLCFDKSHGHPLGGGHWWVGGYWTMLDAIRQAMPKDRILTTECNAEPYIRWFDGYLTWHWQYDRQVPAFPAVYGGAIQMFGRNFAGGETKDLALRMKVGQQLVFGEQIGWFGSDILRDKENAAFVRQVVRLRHAVVRYFYAGEMARPPKLSGEMPQVTADWQWSGKRLVTTDAVMTGAWRLPTEKKAVVLMVNVSDQAVTAKLELDGKQYGLDGPELRLTKYTSEGAGGTSSVSGRIDQEVTVPPRTAWAWEVGRGGIEGEGKHESGR